ncbi:MAG: helix-turn-helix transcriptional regulator [Clostridia bacterium]|nr:helix-turn-helix transcriptional regulator [Clostridia bacterium]
MKYNRIKDLREDADKNQSQVAEDLGLYTTTYARYERGEQEIPLCIAKALAEYYNISLDYIAGLIDTPRKLK